MDPHTYQQWWALHLRAARCENLTAEERAFYVAGLKQLQQEEILEGHRAGIHELRAAVPVLQAEHGQLRAQREEQDERLRAAAKALKDLYEPGGELTEWTGLDAE